MSHSHQHDYIGCACYHPIVDFMLKGRELNQPISASHSIKSTVQHAQYQGRRSMDSWSKSGY